MITTQEWDLIQNLVDVLEPFAEATDYLGGSSYCTHSIINPLIEEIKRSLISVEYSESSQSSPAVYDVIEETNNNEDAFNEEDLDKESDQCQISLNRPVNTFGLLDIVKTK